ncbi:hypothetical protein [Mucilaginibacter sp.]|uniref:hypothetical protein n=1 Tax=Mucilaginibacter sp. TaxID=1882438 RepID=UPI000CB60843|nr:hypothetical protein [Mucilaginibacter sp.]PLW90894.1 MAG: hypothetical protein C0154_03990 [Mucilaginibacter sp.]HEK20498.1 hypothetical protein [Bacteroidota bacterium]
MKNNIIIVLAAFLVSAMAISGCKKNDYKNDGGKSNPYVNMTTYDYLKSNPQFDSLVKVIDRAGLKDVVNSNITFFATTNYSIVPYVAAKKNQVAIQTGNENFNFGIKDIPAQELSDSLKTYMFQGVISRDQITLDGKLYTSLLGPIPNVQYLIKFRRSFDYNSYLDHVDYVTYTKVRGTRDDQEPDLNAIPNNLKDLSADVQTSGIVTKTGVVHVLTGFHRLFFNAQPLGN